MNAVLCYRGGHQRCVSTLTWAAVGDHAAVARTVCVVAAVDAALLVTGAAAGPVICQPQLVQRVPHVDVSRPAPTHTHAHAHTHTHTHTHTRTRTHTHARTHAHTHTNTRITGGLSLFTKRGECSYNTVSLPSAPLLAEGFLRRWSSAPVWRNRVMACTRIMADLPPSAAHRLPSLIGHLKGE